ncbi:MAG TPA: TadE/TadG family type IV pilus assembly protein [Candidatus Acidoferrales bacterium]|nr:TadE/TadG family type IV pilus assembly protein [Candidatus Acidoferrales bacterium]
MRCGQTRERGSTLVEFALVFILFMTILLGIAGFGHALYAYHYVSSAARQATRWAIVNGADCTSDNTCTAPASKSDVQTFVQNVTPQGIDWSQVTVTTCGMSGDAECADSTLTACATTVNDPGCVAQVKVSYNFQFVFPLLPTNTLTLSSTSEMIIAH